MIHKNRKIPACYYFLEMTGCFTVIACLLISSCQKIGYGTGRPDNKLVVLAEITAEDTANIPIGSTLPAGTGSIIAFQKLDQIDATITQQNGGVQALSLNTSADFSSDPMAVYSGSEKFNYNSVYSFTATDPNLGSITATTTIPDRFIVEQPESEMDDLNGKQVLKFAFVLNDAPDQKNYYIFSGVKQLVNILRYFFWQGIRYDYNTPLGYNLYQLVQNNPGVVLLRDTILTPRYIQLRVYTRDNNTANAGIGSLDSSYKRIFLPDSLFNGNTYETEFYVAADKFQASSPQETGIVQVQIKSVSRELYDYLLQYEKYNSDFGNFPVGNLSSPQGNVQNGFGVFGGSSKKQWSFYYDSLQ